MGAPRGAVKPDLVATMSIPLARLGARAPISLTPDGAFQLAGVVRKTALLISSEDAFSWDRSSGSDERDMLNFLDAQEPRRGDFLLLGTGAALSFPRLRSGPRWTGVAWGLRSWTPALLAAPTTSLLLKGACFPRRSYPLLTS